VLRGILNLGILAHVDAGKTTLTERLLYSAGVLDEVGSVDEGTTQTDSLALERQRGITIKSAVVSFTVGGTTVNLIDTPGHPDFVAEVERALSVLDGAVLVVSAVEGVQPQTRILWRALQRLRVPTLFFVNKIDRRGAGYDRVLGDIAERLTSANSERARPRSSRMTRPTRRSGRGWPNCWPSTTTGSSAPTSMPRRCCRPIGSASDWPCRSGTRWCTPCSSGPPSPARASRCCCTS
jgi:small GTP-binding protein